MSHLPKDWEADIRQKVNDHEFSYDPAAWEEMSSLLDQVATGSAVTHTGPNPVASSSLKLWSIIAITSAVTVTVLALLLWHKQKKSIVPEVESWSIEVAPPENSVDTLSFRQKSQERVLPPQNQKRSLSEKELLPVADDESLVSSPAASPVRLDQGELSPLPQLVIPQELKPTTPPPSVALPAIQLPPPPKRNRNRKTFFPDVIEHYKN